MPLLETPTLLRLVIHTNFFNPGRPVRCDSCGLEPVPPILQMRVNTVTPCASSPIRTQNPAYFQILAKGGGRVQARRQSLISALRRRRGDQVAPHGTVWGK